jgi:hypothetical protein
LKLAAGSWQLAADFMPTDDSRRAFDENAALEELERLREEIREVRSRREKKVEEFESWVRETRAASRAERVAALEENSTETTAATAAWTATRAAEATNRTSVSAASPGLETSRTRIPLDDAFKDDAFKEDRERAARHPRLGGRGSYYAAGAAVVLIAAAAIPRFLHNREPEDVGARNAAQTPPAAQRPETVLPPIRDTPAAPAPVADPRPLQIELFTIRPVWLRVTVDGERRLEREVPGGQRLPFGADRSINVRAGNGGSLRLSVGGRDLGLIGRDGQIADRTLTAR